MKYPLFILVALSLYSCGKSSSENEAYKHGEKTAAILIDSIQSMSEMELEGYLLNVRATEYKYITDGDSAASVSFIEGFEEYIKANSDSIQSLIF